MSYESRDLDVAVSGQGQAQVWSVTFSSMNAMRKPAPDNVTFSPAGTYSVPVGTTPVFDVQYGTYQYMGTPPARYRVFVPAAGTTPVRGTTNANGTWTAPGFTNLTPLTTYTFRVLMTCTPASPSGTDEATRQFTTPP